MRTLPLVALALAAAGCPKPPPRDPEPAGTTTASAAPSAAPSPGPGTSAAPSTTADGVPPITVREHCAHAAKSCPKLDVDACTRRLDRDLGDGRCFAPLQAWLQCSVAATEFECDSAEKGLPPACEPLVEAIERCLSGR